MPETAATKLIPWLMAKYPGEYSAKHTRTLQRRIAQWRLEQGSQEEKMRALMITEKESLPAFTIETAASESRRKSDNIVGDFSQSLA